MNTQNLTFWINGKQFVLVPVEPTEEFIDEAVDRYFKLEGTTKDHFDVDERSRAVIKQWYRAFITP